MTKPITFHEGIAAQGDMTILDLSHPDIIAEYGTDLPKDAKQEKADARGDLVVTHSETGHNHVIRESDGAQLFQAANDELLCFMVIDNDKGVDLRHLRDHDTHKTIHLPKGKYRVHRQREHSPEGWRRAID